MFFTFWPDLGNTPARVNRFTGEIQINNRYFRNMPDFRKQFIIEHEKGHFNLDTRSEFEADAYAFKKMAGTHPYSLKESVKSISQVLTFRNPEHLQRLTAIVQKALEFDYKHNANLRAKDALDQLNEFIKTQSLNNFYMNSANNDFFEPQFGGSDIDIYDNAGGKAKRQARKQARQQKKQARQQNRQQKKQNRLANRQARVEARTTRKATRQNARVARKQTRVEARVARKNTRITAQDPYLEQAPSQDMLSDTWPSENQNLIPSQSYPAESYPAESYPAESYPAEEYPQDENTEEEYPDNEPEPMLDENGELINPDEYYDNASGKAARQARKAARQKNREERRKQKADRKAARTDVIKARADAKRTKAEAKMELAKQGKSGSDWLGGAVDSIASIFGGGKTKDLPPDPANDLPAEDPNAGKILGMPKGAAIAVIAVVVILIIVGIVFLLKRKK